jgi:hypothetical protein
MKRRKTASKKPGRTSAAKRSAKSAKPAAKRAVKRANGQSKEAVGHVIERPNGFYVQAPSGEESGPYRTLAEAETELLAVEAAEPDIEAGDLQEAESDIGVNEWIDPETGGPAEDSVPRIEDH